MMLEERSANRSKHEITRDILAFLAIEPRRKTHVMGSTRMPYDQVKRYTTSLFENKLVREENGYWVLTQAGKEKLALLEEVCA